MENNTFLKQRIEEANNKGIVDGAICKCLVSERYGKIKGDLYISGDRIHAKTDSLNSGFIVIYNGFKFSEVNRESELIKLLEEALNLLDDFSYEAHLQERRANINMNAQSLIWEIRNNAPKLLDDE